MANSFGLASPISDLEITDPKNGETITSSDVSVEWSIDNYDPVTRGDRSVIYIDGEYLAVTGNTNFTIRGVSEGSHTVTVEAYEGDGSDGPTPTTSTATASDTVTFTVSPSDGNGGGGGDDGENGGENGDGGDGENGDGEDDKKITPEQEKMIAVGAVGVLGAILLLNR